MRRRVGRPAEGRPAARRQRKGAGADPYSVKDRSKDDIVEALSSGFTPAGDSLGGAMGAAARNIAELSPAYRAAIADYLKEGRE